MEQNFSGGSQQFQTDVAIKFQLYNSLFLSLPFDRIEKTGILLSLFLSNSEEGYEQNKSPLEIIENFFRVHTSITKEAEKIDLLFRFVQYAERQVVLFDALEDAAFGEINDLQGAGTLKNLEATALQNNQVSGLAERLKDFSVRLVLTAHPTQFYPGSVLGIINDLIAAIGENRISDINTYLRQLGRTPFIKKQKPTPFDEAASLVWYLENVFYEASGSIVSELGGFLRGNGGGDEELGGGSAGFAPPIRMGFWPGGDRDGNPFVTVETTLKVADALHSSILKCYHREVRRLKRRLTFAGVESILSELEVRLYQNIYEKETSERLTKQEILRLLGDIRRILMTRHDGLFARLVEGLIYKVETFGLFFASLDIRQESGVHDHVLANIAAADSPLPADYSSLTDEQKIESLLQIGRGVRAEDFSDAPTRDTLETISAVKRIQAENGREACERYVISQCGSALDAVEVYALFLLSGAWSREDLSVDIVPLFETVTDLKNSAEVMRRLYELPDYRRHLADRRNNTQTIMLGFSDGTKDGGYLTANWGIYKAKDELTRISERYGVNVVFFDGRGGPPARGGGKTHKFYASMGRNVASGCGIQLTVQGQTVSSNFGTVEAARYNIEQLLHAGLYSTLFGERQETFDAEEEAIMRDLSETSYEAYCRLKEHPAFLDYLSEVSPLRFYSETNIGSRPAKRGGSKKLSLKDLRAIPFVGAWSQLKQNVPGFYGVGSAIYKLEREGKLARVGKMYRENAFFKALIDNCEMAMQKSFFPLTQFLAEDPEYGEMWRMIYEEFELTRRCIFQISGRDGLMHDYPVDLQSIQMRERIMLPLTTIQQYALTKLRAGENLSEETKTAYEKLIIRCSFGIINAGRNSA